MGTEAKIDSSSLSDHHDSSRPSAITSINQTFPVSQRHLKQSAVVGGVLLPLPVAVVHLVPAAGQKQLTGAVQGCRVQRLAVDQADQVLPVVLPAGAKPHQGKYKEPGGGAQIPYEVNGRWNALVWRQLWRGRPAFHKRGKKIIYSSSQLQYFSGKTLMCNTKAMRMT